MYLEQYCLHREFLDFGFYLSAQRHFNMDRTELNKPNAEKIIRKGWTLIDSIFSQEEIRQQFEKKGIKLSKATISNIYGKYVKPFAVAASKDASIYGDTSMTEIRAIGKTSLIKFAEGLLWLLLHRKKLTYDFTQGEFIPISNGSGIDLESINVTPSIYLLRTHEEGRRGIAEKIEFIKDAKHEVIEMGIRLNTFSKYFIGRNDSEFKDHIVTLLDRGVELKCLMMDPEAAITRYYFEDRAKANPREIKAFKEMPLILEDLKLIQSELNGMSLQGKMRIFLYQNFPYHHYLSVDGANEWGKMMYSSYIYGEKRANCPVVDLYQYGSPTLYARHWNALQLVLNQSTEIY